MVAFADLVSRRKPKPRVYLCALCDKPVKQVKPGDVVFSRVTRRRYHTTCLLQGSK